MPSQIRRFKPWEISESSLRSLTLAESCSTYSVLTSLADISEEAREKLVWFLFVGPLLTPLHSVCRRLE